MKVSEFVNCFGGNDFNVESVDCAKKYLPVEEKRKLAVGVISMCTDDIDGFVEVNKFRMKIYLEMFFLREYFSIDVSNDFDELVKEYDLVCESGILHQARSLLSYEYDEFKEILDQELNDLLEENSLQKQVVKVVIKLNEMVEIFGDKIKDININEMLPEGANVMNSLSNILGMFK